MSVKSIAEEYFSNLNSIAARLYSDLEETKLSYEQLWSTLSEKQKGEILSESIIKPEICIKYSPNEGKPETDYAIKLIYDDHCSYRDEHSGPFSLRTKSQRNLNIFQTEKPNITYEHKTKVPKPKPKPLPCKTSMAGPKSITQISEANTNEESYNSLPKTGLDFLDNW